MIRCGIIGYGKMGQIRARAIEASGRGEVVVVYDPAPPLDSPYSLAESPEEIIQASNLDAVFVCTPNYLNPSLVCSSLDTGKHVFSEKPPAFNADGVCRIRQHEETSVGCKLMYGFNHRHHPSIVRMKQIVDSGELGRILWMRGRYGKEVDESYFYGWRADPKKAGGGIFLDQGIHMLDLFLHLGGGFDEVQAMVSNLYWRQVSTEDNVFANFRSSETGICASLHSTMTQWGYLFSLEVCLEKGLMTLNGLKTSSGCYGQETLAIRQRRTNNEEQTTYNEDPSWNSEIAHFFDGIEQDRPITMGSSLDALRVMELVDRVYSES